MNNIVRKDLVHETGKKPGYNKTKLGWIPEEWEVVKLGDIGKLTSGTTPPRAKHERYFKNGSIKWIKTTDLNNGIITKTEENVTHVALDETSLKVLPKNTLLIAMYGGFNQIGRTGLLKIDATINQALSALIINKNDIDPIFLLNWLNHKVGLWRRFAASSRKDPNITKNDVKHFPFFKPPLPEQQKIATILSTWEKAIELTQRLIVAKEVQKKGLMQQLLTGKVRMKGYCEEWKEVRIGRIINESKIGGVGNDIYKRLTVRLSLKGVKKREVKGNESTGATNYFVRKSGQFIYGKQNLHKGALGIIPLELDGYETTSDIPSFDFKKGFYPKWFLQLFSRKHFYESLEKLSTGTGSKRIKPKILLRTKIKVPQYDEQTAIATILTKSDDEIELLNQKLKVLKEQKKGLMQVLLTGKLRVNTKK